LGAFPDFGGPEDEVTAGKVKDYKRLIGKGIAWACFSGNRYNGIRYPQEHIHAIHQVGVTPLVRLMPRSSSEIEGVVESRFSLQHIIEGGFDRALHQWARDAKQDGTFSLLRVDSSDASLHTFRQWIAHPSFADNPRFSASYCGFLPAIYGLLSE